MREGEEFVKATKLGTRIAQLSLSIHGDIFRLRLSRWRSQSRQTRRPLIALLRFARLLSGLGFRHISAEILLDHRRRTKRRRAGNDVQQSSDMCCGGFNVVVLCYVINEKGEDKNVIWV